MNVEEANNMPLSNKGMTPELNELQKMMDEMPVGAVRKLTDNNRSPESVKSSVMGQARRLPQHKFKVVIRDSAVYVQKLPAVEQQEVQPAPQEVQETTEERHDEKKHKKHR